MRRRPGLTWACALSTLYFGLGAAFAQPIGFTGDVEADFAPGAPGVIVLADPAGVDVGMPLQFPAGQISGNDIKDVRLSYDAATDTLYVGVNTYGIAGDVDGDGNPGGSSLTLLDLGGFDLPDLSGTEALTVQFDIDQNGTFDVIAGVSAANADIDDFSVNVFAGSPFAPGVSFGAPLPAYVGTVFGSPDAAGPDFEFTLVNFSGLLGRSANDTSARFGINAFMGSFGDAGIGEDFAPGAAQTLDICLTPHAPDVCNDFDDDCDGRMDEDVAAKGERCRVGAGACAATGVLVCDEAGALRCDAEAGAPSTERCDGIDNDCDGLVDEDLPVLETVCGRGACASIGAQICQDGHLVDTCTPGAPGAEVCNGADDDCDGAADEHIAPKPTACGESVDRGGRRSINENSPLVDSCTPGKPGVEQCNGEDDDCDGKIDEDVAPRPTRCGVGACAARGNSVCVDGEFVDSCTPGKPGAEVCDAVDNDCDGAADEGIAPVPSACGVGACGAVGQIVCDKGRRIDTCTPGKALPEACDAVDNDCDGRTDEDIRPQVTHCGVGECRRDGRQVCNAGKLTDTCRPGRPSDEICDEADNDCDGAIDEGRLVYRFSDHEDGPGYGLMAWDFNGDGIYRWHLEDDMRFVVDEDGTATLDGTASVRIIESGPGDLGEQWHVHMDFVYRGQGPEFGGPFVRELWLTPEVTDLWQYWDMIGGTMTRPGSVVTLEQRPRSGNYPFQLGLGANQKNHNLGAAMWFYYVRTDADGRVIESRGDLNPDAELIGGEGCTPQDEVCDGIDNDLDGAIDEGFNVGAACHQGEGACATDGSVECTADGGAACNAPPPAEAGDEICDGEDNDCDGAVDEDIAPVPSECGEGACAAQGEIACIDGCLVDSCTPGAPGDEVCDAVDNDCDGETDEGARVYALNEYAANGHAIDLPGFTPNHVQLQFRDDARLTLRTDGTGSITGTAYVFSGPLPAGQEWSISVDLTDRGIGPEFGGPKIERPALQPPAISDLWEYWDVTGGTFIGPHDTVTITMRPADGHFPLQLGWAANNKDADFGLSFWFFWRRVSDNGAVREGVGDFNLDADPLEDEGCTAPPEVCDDIDNDHDGAVDEGFDVGAPCQVGVGACAAEGHRVCDDEGGTTCDAQPGAPSDEVCDGVDNDCDGATDEGIAPVPSECGVGACAAQGQVACINGCLVDSCTPGAPADEICDTADNDCDGEVDEGVDIEEYAVTEYAGGHALWLPDFNAPGHLVRMRFREDGRFVVRPDGTALLVSTAYIFDLGGGPGVLDQEWVVTLDLRYRGQGAAFGGPKIELPALQTPAVTDLWHYYDLANGTLARPEEVVPLTQRPANGQYPFQFGMLANGKDATLGASMWFDWSRETLGGDVRNGHGDVNVSMTDGGLSCEEEGINPVCAVACREQGQRHTRDCINLGYPQAQCEELLEVWLDQCIRLQCC
ncbi:MAG: hypothetical protein KC620_06465 [Myxococcales bacterium]|nr:hypothetical protein [Myxococcales bacterium]